MKQEIFIDIVAEDGDVNRSTRIPLDAIRNMDDEKYPWVVTLRVKLFDAIASDRSLASKFECTKSTRALILRGELK